VLPWDGVKKCDTFSAICPQQAQQPGAFYFEEFYWDGYPENNEDCLYLNVWAPAATVGKTDAKLPVAFWIHGGAYSTGWGATKSMDGDAWARNGVILVTINYRLNLLGFLAHPELTAEEGTSGNYGMYDQVAALKWVYENIAQFGGDPSNITVMGQSAGAMSVKNLVISPLAKPYIAKAIIQSGGGLGRASAGASTSQQEASDQAGKAFVESGGYDTLEKMRAASYAELQQNCKGRMGMGPHIDGKILTKTFDEAVADKSIADIPYLIGYTADDIPMLAGESNHRFCAARAVDSRQPVYEYAFNRKLPGDDAGAFHSSELWYMFNTLSRSRRPFTQADYDLSEQMVTCWTNFAKYGNPNGQSGNAPWHQYTAEDPFLMEFDVK